MAHLNLTDLHPKDAKFTVEIHGTDRKANYTFRLRAFTLRDDAWLQNNFDTEELTKKLALQDTETLGRIVYNQLVAEDKRFLHDNIKIEDSDGRIVQDEFDGHHRLLACLQGTEAQQAMYFALMEARGVSSVLEEEDIIKKIIPAEKPKKSRKPTLRRWLTPWRRHTAGA